ncbi:hypothetical protein [Pedosphaera parvula]|uniref:Uncharacterized protein n=1 Tax=Pedosphaera parvula (strain Ellin514) TaxID=320771 RepID=B9XJG5_PEDPL|nr:hypothetical protein [Pedosphaera parvula]EEF60026.1 hypothetical protein Cflav_PD3085 [Pedosphaera parvula Ellin514]
MVLVLEKLRDKYSVRDAAWQNPASAVMFLLAAFCLGADPHALQSATLFAFSAIMGAISLIFLKRKPDVEIPEAVMTRDSVTEEMRREILIQSPQRVWIRLWTRA